MMAPQIDKNEIAEFNPPTLQKLFEDSSIAKLLDFVTLYRDFDYPKTEISRNSGVSWKTLYRLWPILEKYNLVIKTRQIGRATLYKLNTESPIAHALSKLTLEIAAFGVTEELARQAKEKKNLKTEPTPA
jgi:DNA-binding transcriptional ArsR family regulator